MRHFLLTNIIILMLFHVVGVLLSDKHLVSNLAIVFEMVTSPAFSVSLFLWHLPVALPFFYHSAASTSRDVISGTSSGSMYTMVLCSLLYSSVVYSSDFSIRSMILS